MKTFLLASIMLALPVAGWSAPSPAVPYSALSPSDFKIIGGQVFVRLNSAIILTNQTILITTNVNVTNAYFFINGTNVATVNPTDSYLPKRQSATNFIDSLAHDDGSWFSIDGFGTSTLELESDDGQIVFGSGGTNVLFRSGRDLVYSNSVTTVDGVGYVLEDGSGNIGKLMVSGHVLLLAPLGNATETDLRDGANNTVRWSQKQLTPSQTGSELGAYSSSNPYNSWSNLWLNGKAVIEDPTLTGTTNFSRIVSWHGGTNDAIHFDSQSAGTAGNPVPVAVDFNGVNGFKFLPTGEFVLSNGFNNVTMVKKGYASFFSKYTNDTAFSAISYTANGISSTASPLGLLKPVDIAIATAVRWTFDTNYNFWPSSSTYSIGLNSLPTGNIYSAGNLVLTTAHTPASSAETNYVGAICWDASYLYVWTALNVNKRIPLNAW